MTATRRRRRRRNQPRELRGCPVIILESPMRRQEDSSYREESG
jgi:hypothetical protein